MDSLPLRACFRDILRLSQIAQVRDSRRHDEQCSGPLLPKQPFGVRPTGTNRFRCFPIGALPLRHFCAEEERAVSTRLAWRRYPMSTRAEKVRPKHKSHIGKQLAKSQLMPRKQRARRLQFFATGKVEKLASIFATGKQNARFFKHFASSGDESPARSVLATSHALSPLRWRRALPGNLAGVIHGIETSPGEHHGIGNKRHGRRSLLHENGKAASILRMSTLAQQHDRRRKPRSDRRVLVDARTLRIHKCTNSLEGLFGHSVFKLRTLRKHIGYAQHSRLVHHHCT